jgi:hypothetical protein
VKSAATSPPAQKSKTTGQHSLKTGAVSCDLTLRMRSVCSAQSQKSLACLSFAERGTSKPALRSSALKKKKEKKKKKKRFPI